MPASRPASSAPPCAPRRLHLEAELQFAQEARNALLYPLVLIGSGMLATLVMFVFVVPRFAAVLDNPKADLPWISKLVLGLGLWLTQHQVVVGADRAVCSSSPRSGPSRAAEVRQARLGAGVAHAGARPLDPACRDWPAGLAVRACC